MTIEEKESKYPEKSIIVFSNPKKGKTQAVLKYFKTFSISVNGLTDYEIEALGKRLRKNPRVNQTKRTGYKYKHLSLEIKDGKGYCFEINFFTERGMKNENKNKNIVSNNHCYRDFLYNSSLQQ